MRYIRRFNQLKPFIKSPFIIFLLLATFSCAVPVKVDVEQAQLIPKEQALAFLNSIEVNDKNWAHLKRDLKLEYVIWDKGEKVIYEDLEIIITSIGGIHYLCLCFKGKSTIPNENIAYIQSYNPYLENESKKILNALASLGATVRVVE
ncbi:MAG: hypothetical protein NE328_02680 [Lentisphaeraceae bacterium]|nr:hypothetical protein [Lentisphaeraceae bacterium]